MFLALTAAALAAAPLLPPPPAPGPAVTRLEATSAPPVDPPAQAGEALRFSRLSDDRMTVKVEVGSNGPFRFLVDTGADRSAVSRELATRLGLPRGHSATLHSVTGVSTVDTASLRGMQIASRTLPDVHAPLLEAEHVGADGILGTDVLKSAMVRFDFRQGLLSITPKGRAQASRPEPDTIVVEAQRKSGRLIVTEAELDGQRLTVVLDTGSEISIGNAALHRALARRRQLGTERPVTLYSVTGSTLPASYIVARQLDIGSVSLTDLGIAFAEAHTFKAMGIDQKPALLLGMNALKAFDSLTIDMAAKKLRFVLPSGSGGREQFAANGAPRPGL